MKKVLLATFLLIASPFSFSEINLPSLGESSEEALPLSTEREIGQEIMQEIRNGRFGMRIYDDPETNEYIQKIGARLVRYSDVPGGSIEFFLIDDPTMNAMALPGGFIGVHTGLISSAQTESELASVIAHEIAHVSQRHIARSVMKQKQAQPLQMLALLFAVAIAGGNPQAAAVATTASIAAADQFFLNYSRDFEREADRIGFQTIVRSGYNPGDYVLMFERMYKSYRLYDSGIYPAYLRTHPMTWERVADIQNLLKDQKTAPIDDSVGFHLVRIKIQTERMNPKDAISEYSKQLSERRYLKEFATRYGLGLAYFKTNQYPLAKEQIEWLTAHRIEHPMVKLLKGRLLMATESPEKALQWYRQVLASHPDDFSVLYDYSQALLQTGNYKELVDILTKKVMLDRSDRRLFLMLAQAHQKLGNVSLYHANLAEAYARQGNYHDAIIQIELAQNSKGATFYDQSIHDARLREFKRRFAERMKSET